MTLLADLVNRLRRGAGTTKPAPLPAEPTPPPPARRRLAYVTPGLLRALGWTDPAGYADPLAAACERYDILTPRRLAAFLAQVGHESGRGFYTRELWGPTTAQLNYDTHPKLGNTEKGDGYRFRGRGLIQITGRYNYEQAASAFGRSIESLPAWLESREGAITSAAWWWATHGCNELADADDFKALTRRINGGLNGYNERLALYKAALAALPATMEA